MGLFGNASKKHDFLFDLGSMVKDRITGFTGMVTHRSQWLNNCNTYGVKPIDLKDGVPREAVGFDEPQLELVSASVYEPNQSTGGPERVVERTNRL